MEETVFLCEFIESLPVDERRRHEMYLKSKRAVERRASSASKEMKVTMRENFPTAILNVKLLITAGLWREVVRAEIRRGLDGGGAKSKSLAFDRALLRGEIRRGLYG